MRHVAHDLNNHIAALLSFSELILDDMEPGHALRSRIETIRALGNRVVMRSTPDGARLAQVVGDVAQIRGVAFSVLADIIDVRSALHADMIEIAVAAEQALALLSHDDVRVAA